MITGEFDEEILQDLINEGYEGDTLLQKFKEMRGKVPAAMEKMLNDLIEQSGGKFYTMKEVFGDEWNNFSATCKKFFEKIER